MSFAEHLIARIRGVGEPSLVQPERANWLWSSLRRSFELVFSCVLMPDHLHLVAAAGQQRRLRAIVGAYSARFGTHLEVIVQPAASVDIAFRTVRYGLMNPVRAKLVADPWQWPWSTLRDLGGAAFPVWTERNQVAALLERSPRRLLSAVTHTADYSPAPPIPTAVGFASTSSIVAAVAAACRLQPQTVLRDRLGRRLCVQTCRQLGAPRLSVVARELGMTQRAVGCLSAPPHPALSAVLTCLADPRLTHRVLHHAPGVHVVKRDVNR